MHLTVPSHWSRSIVTGGRDESERVVTIVVARIQIVQAQRFAGEQGQSAIDPPTSETPANRMD